MARFAKPNPDFEDESYHDDPVEQIRSKSRLGKNHTLLASVLILIGGTFFLQTSLAANININSGGRIEYGQGISQLTACSGQTSLLITPKASFTNTSGSGSFYFSSFTISNIPAGCSGATFSLNAYTSAGGTAMALFDTTTTTASIYDDSGNFLSSSGSSLTVVTNSSSSFTATFTNPVALATNVAKILLQSTTAAMPYNYNSIIFTPTTYLTMSPGVTMGSGAFTIDTWIKTGSSIHGGDIIGNANASNSFSFILDSATKFHTDGYGINAHEYLLASNLQPNTWYHVALVRDASLNSTLWVNGTRSSSGVVNDPINYGTAAVGINWAYCTWCVLNNSVFNGERISNLRVVVGSSLYDPSSTTITVPTMPLSNVTNTKLLLLFNSAGSITTDSSGNQTVTNNGTTFVSGQ